MNWADDVIVNIQWHIGKSSSPTHRSMRPHRMLLYVTSVYLYTYMLFSDWIPSNSGSHWKVCVCLCVSMCEVCMNRFAHCICCWQSICIIRQDAVMCLPLAFASHVVCCGSVKSWDLLFRLPRENVKRPLNVSRYVWSLHDWQVPRLVAKPLKYDCNYQWSKWTTSM